MHWHCFHRVLTVYETLTHTPSLFVSLCLQVLDLPDDRLPYEITLIAIDLLVTMVEHEVTPFMTAPKVRAGGRCEGGQVHTQAHVWGVGACWRGCGLVYTCMRGVCGVCLCVYICVVCSVF